jgi:hypothetical protein
MDRGATSKGDDSMATAHQGAAHGRTQAEARARDDGDSNFFVHSILS